MKVNPFIVFDFETGGLKGQKNPVTEVAMLCIDGVTLMEIGRYSSYVKPYLYEYDQKALDYTGTTMEKLQQEGKDLKVVVDEMVACVKEWHRTANGGTYTKKPILVGHNADKFDSVFLQQIFKETKNLLTIFEGDVDFHGNYRVKVVDTIDISKFAYGADETMPNFQLGTCVSKVGLSLNDAHKAMNDVVGTKEMLIKYVERLRNDLSGMLAGDGIQKIRFREKFQFQF